MGETQLNDAAIHSIRKLADEAAGPTVLAIPGQVGHKVKIWANGKLEDVVLDPKPRCHSLSSLKALLDFGTNVTDGKHGKGPSPVAWMNHDGISIVVNDADRRDMASLTMPITPQFQLLNSGNTAQPRSQADFVKFLRIEMDGTLPDKTLLSLLREMKFENNTAGNANIQHGRESMGKSIEAQVLGLSSIPEEITVSVRVFAVPDILVRCNIRCAIDIIVINGQFRLVPLPMQVQDGMAAALATVRTELETAFKFPVYEGKP